MFNNNHCSNNHKIYNKFKHRFIEVIMICEHKKKISLNNNNKIRLY